ncbi:hypothetical protein QFC20_002480 [Naganishia adeliensis]|uniref:Uncharacterized protein n=1 Tax=Naganishia adeliensis TaxID=92952 RepID=A0ACC2WK25_9TREE|nr:hypothetical protein QFC20_002480 [Naganishia adeliensis]
MSVRRSLPEGPIASIASSLTHAVASTILNKCENEYTAPGEFPFIRSDEPHVVIEQLSECLISGYYYKQEDCMSYTICFKLAPGRSTPGPPDICWLLQIESVEGKSIHQVVDALLHDGMKAFGEFFVHWMVDPDDAEEKAGLEYFCGDGWQYERFKSKRRMAEPAKDEL